MHSNQIILDKITSLEIPEDIKGILKEILNTEEEMKILNATKDFRKNIDKLLEKYANDEKIKEFCKKYESN